MINMGNIENLTPEEVQKYYRDLFYDIFNIILTLDYKKNNKETIKQVMFEIYDIYKKEI